MLKKFFVATLMLCMSLLLFSTKTSAEEMELVSYSAQVKLQWLAKTGMPEAQEILNKLGKANIYGKRNLQDYERLETVNSIFQEFAYASTAEYIKNNDYKNILDIGGGYTPRAVVMARDGRKYYGAELVAVAVSATPIIKGILGSKYADNVFYDEVLAEDREKMLDAAYTFNGKICVVEQGLMIYLTDARADAFYKNVKEVITKKNSRGWQGGCFISSDFMTKNIFKEIAAALYGEDQAQLLYDETKDMYEELFDGLINDDLFDSPQSAINYLDKRGLKVEQVPLLNDPSKLYCLKSLTSEQAEKIKQIASKKYLWVLTAK